MKIFKSICLSLAVVAGTALGARGGEMATNINPALLYYRSFLLAPDPISSADLDYFLSKKGRSQKLPERFGQLAASYDNEFELVRQAAHQVVPCDWGIDLSVGPYAMLPHLARAKAIVQASQVRAAWDLPHGRQDAARDDLVAAFVLGRNASRDETIIGTLVQYACEAIVYGALAQHFGEFSPETIQQLEVGFDAAPAPGVMADNMAGERLCVHDWLAEKLQRLQRENPGNDAKVLEAIHPDYKLLEDAQPFFGEKKETDLWQHMLAVSRGTSDGILKLLREMDPFYVRLAEIMSLPEKEFEDPAAKFNAEIETSPNPLMKVLFPFPKMRAREFRVQAEAAMVRAAMEYKVHGQAGLKSVNDPFGSGPFDCQRFKFNGEDWGFALKSAYTGAGAPLRMIFVEKAGAPFFVEGPHTGEPVAP